MISRRKYIIRALVKQAGKAYKPFNTTIEATNIENCREIFQQACIITGWEYSTFTVDMVKQTANLGN